MGIDFDSFVLTAATADLDDEPAAREHADAVEYRMDLAADPLEGLRAYDGELPILATNRAAWEGGEWDGDDDERLAALEEALATDAVEAIDVELESLRSGAATDLRTSARDHGVSVVASAHDFEATPDEIELMDTLSDACERADVGKLATTAETRADTLALLAVTHRLTESGRTVATMAMGEAGSHTRAVAPVYGSKIGYAPVDPAEATAPGQYDLETLSRLIATLENE
ncbi:type I 3-dehydroquinate dehydratase [Natrarchaeobius halalkaliphilus]|uniref:3-dehydroquinate dehydratase n=1 Tax=Natrarchaeobius halalkaliphilus TaxID=1679091 RepID=A0A3N6NWQ1_9EURY|nr:type I 3-dehydroquinate dehydratase [Natrarchaeobius halalkaliphilus]RQG88989.1 type I 3-dehydroquinate dehydratase [Natrarchaeobius halalkaliphilus]